MTSAWRTRPVFISSTFKDMQAERDWLQHHVFPRLKEELRKRRRLLEPIDLRIGVETANIESEEGRELQVLKVCLDEISRSRPFLLVLLGDRYGWVPPKERMEVAAQEKGFETDLSNKSVTALEIEFGILKEHPDQKRRSLFFFRNPLPYDSMPPDVAAAYCDACSTDPSVKAGHDKLIALKDKLKNDDDLGVHVFEYTADWDESTQRVTGLEEFGNLVFEKLWEAIEADTKEFVNQRELSPDEQERVDLEEFIEERGRDFVGRETLLSKLHEFVSSPCTKDTPWAICVIGSPGSGKSALLSHFYQKCSQAISTTVLFTTAEICTQHFVNTTLSRWIRELSEICGAKISTFENVSTSEIIDQFLNILSQAVKNQQVIIIVDGLDRAIGSYAPSFLHNLGKSWPTNAKLIITVEEKELSYNAWPVGIENIDLPCFSEAEAIMLAQQVWRRHHRQCPQGLMDTLIDKPNTNDLGVGNPMWIVNVMEQLNLLGADDFFQISRTSSTPQDQQLSNFVLPLTELEFSSACVNFEKRRKTPCQERERITPQKKKSVF